LVTCDPGLDQDARELAALYRHVVGPFQRDRELRQLLDRFRAGEAEGRGDQTEHIERQDGTKDQGELQRSAGLREPYPSEAAALALYDGRGAVRLIDIDHGHRALLLERAEPGEWIRSLPDEEATRIAAETMKLSARG